MEFTTGPIELDGMMKCGEDITIVDVRHDKDYRKSHIPGAVGLEESKWDTFEGLSKDHINIVYCYHQQCHLAPKACRLWAEHGYPVMELEGGFMAWEQFSLPVEK